MATTTGAIVSSKIEELKELSIDVRDQYTKYNLELREADLGVELLDSERLQLIQKVTQECNKLIDEQNQGNRLKQSTI